jgi:dTDP-4-amino-4,6-dideoxygalactose transaminase
MIPNAKVHPFGFRVERPSRDEQTVYVTKPFLPPLEEFIPYLEDIWREGWVTNNGHYHQELESALCEYLGVKHVSLFSNGTAALMTAIRELGLEGEVITTPYSFVATAHSLVWSGVRPVFVDIDQASMNICPKAVEQAITSNTTGILPVHVYGRPCKLKEIEAIAQKYGLKVLYDACHAFGVKVDGTSVLNFGDLSVLSFHATKVFNTFEGGAVISHDPETKKRLDLMKNFGFASETEVVMTGMNAKMNEFQSALGVLQLKYVDEAITRRAVVFEHYRKVLSGIEGLTLIEEAEGVCHNYSYFPVLFDETILGFTRDDAYVELKKRNIHARRYFFPLISHFEPYKDNPSSAPSYLRNAEQIAKRVLCLPVYPDLEWPDQMRIVEVITGLRRDAS